MCLLAEGLLKPQSNLRRVWSSTFSASPSYEMAVTKHIKALKCSNKHIIVPQQNLLLLVQNHAQTPMLSGTASSQLHVHEYVQTTISPCGAILYLSRGYNLTDSFAHRKHNEIHQGHLSRNYTWNHRIIEWFGLEET